MRKKYILPCNIVVDLLQEDTILESSYIGTGEDGDFDVKSEYNFENTDVPKVNSIWDKEW